MSSNDNQADEKNPISMETELPPYSDISNAVVDDDEKQPFLNDEKETIFDDKPNHKVTRSSDKLKRVCQILSLFGVIYLVNFVYFNFNDFQRGLSHFKFGLGCNKVQYEPLKQHPIFRNLNDIVETYSFNDEEEGGLSKTKEIISVTNPFVPNPRYGKSLYSAKLLHHSFGNSWGRPAVVNFTAPPKVSFDAVVLTLHTEVDGVQYDRLANLFVDGVQVWRTSTIEPGGRKAFSNFKKDVTKYSKLFKKDNVQILFQLDNLLTDKLTGVFDVTLSIDLYKSHEFGPHHHRGPHHKEHHDREEKEEDKNKDKRQYDSDSDSDSDSDDDSNNEEHHGIKRHKDSNHAKEEKSQKYHKSKNRKHHKGSNSKDSKKKPEKPEHSPDKPSHGPPHKFHKEHEIFSTAKPADQIYPLTFSSKPNQAPVVYLGSGRLAVELPKVSKNTTRLQLSIFTSGNAADEFWYSNVIDKFRDVFADDGNQFIGRGPARAVNIYFNGKKIVTQTPEPVIFTGGISPALWSPVVSFNAFDVPSIDVDVSGLLPYLWEHQAADDKVLEIEISNGLGEIGKDDSLSVNENWVTTANLLTYENDQVVESSGEVINTESFGTGKVVAISPHFTRSFQQFVEVVLKTQIISDITLKLKNGKVLNTTLSTYWQAEIANAQYYGSSGDRQSIVHVGHSTQSFVIQDNDLPESDDSITEKHKNAVPLNAIVSANTSLSYPLVLNLNLLSKKLFDDDGFYIDYEVKLVNSKGVDVLFARDHGSISTSASQNGKSKFVISSKGNHGVGASTSKYNSKFRFGKHGREYHRIVEAVNGTIVSDKTDTHREDEKDNSASVVQVVENHSNYENASEMVNRILRALHGTFEKTRSPCHGSKGMRGMKGHHGDARHSGSH